MFGQEWADSTISLAIRRSPLSEGFEGFAISVEIASAIKAPFMAMQPPWQDGGSFRR